MQQRRVYARVEKQKLTKPKQFTLKHSIPQSAKARYNEVHERHTPGHKCPHKILPNSSPVTGGGGGRFPNLGGHGQDLSPAVAIQRLHVGGCREALGRRHFARGHPEKIDYRKVGRETPYPIWWLLYGHNGHNPYPPHILEGTISTIPSSYIYVSGSGVVVYRGYPSYIPGGGVISTTDFIQRYSYLPKIYAS